MKTLCLAFLLVLMATAGCTQQNPQVIIKTVFGDITVELYPDKAPVTVDNFLTYVKENRFREATFYRVVTLENQPDNDIKIEVIQGGNFDDDHPDSLPPITHETTDQTGIKHKDGVISMARMEPGTANDDFFICIGDQPELDFGGKRNPDGQGFAAFGKVVKGMDVVHKIHQVPAPEQWLEKDIPILAVEMVK
ncbi:MAG: peptidylprolyl isomerase [Marinilabiliales bacterium]|nr:MAG: peptidylprolyl isomerase [Marinilabiliales bacterium]